MYRYNTVVTPIVIDSKGQTKEKNPVLSCKDMLRNVLKKLLNAKT